VLAGPVRGSDWAGFGAAISARGGHGGAESSGGGGGGLFSVPSAWVDHAAVNDNDNDNDNGNDNGHGNDNGNDNDAKHGDRHLVQSDGAESGTDEDGVAGTVKAELAAAELDTPLAAADPVAPAVTVEPLKTIPAWGGEDLQGGSNLQDSGAANSIS
jgi:hypothetical protein